MSTTITITILAAVTVKDSGILPFRGGRRKRR